MHLCNVIISVTNLCVCVAFIGFVPIVSVNMIVCNCLLAFVYALRVQAKWLIKNELGYKRDMSSTKDMKWP